MKKKLLYVIMSLVFALALVGGSVAVLTTSDALSRVVSGETTTDEVTTEGENIAVEGSAEGEDVSVSASVTAANIQASQNGWAKVPSTTVNGVAGGYGYYKNFGYSGSTNTSGNVQYEDLPAGTYLFEAWGAQGGNDGSIGGHGGYIRGIYTLTAATRIYIVVGGYGTCNTGNAAGGYNGGAKAGSYGSSGGGGGATHFATASGVLNALKNNKGAVVLVAGGGGGAGNNGHYGYGGVTPQGNSIGASGGRATGAIVNNNTYFGLGQACVTGGNNDGGGGGGGYWGGWGSTTDSNGGGGQSYYNPGTAGNVRYTAGYAHANGNATMPHPTNYSANKTHNASEARTNGYARITCLNNPPTNKNATIAATARGTGRAVAPSTVADDSGAYHTTRSWAETNRIYTNSACTTLVDSNVLTVSGMTANSTGNMTLTPKRYFGTTTYYVKVRDDMGFVTSVAFKYSVTDNPITALTGINQRTTGSNGTYKYFVGNSTTNVEGDWRDHTDTVNDVIYNPTGTGKYTVFIPKPITQTENGIYINAADLYSDADVGKGYDEIVITSIGNASSSSYNIVTNTADYKYGRGYSRVRIAHNGAATAAGYISSVTLTVQSVEKSTNKLMGSPVTLTVVFKVSNTRPTLKQDTSAVYPDPYYAINVGDTQRINVSDIGVDIDHNRNEIKEIIVPTTEFVYLDTYGNYIQTSLSPNSNYYFTEAQNPKAPDSMTTGRGTKPLSFEPNSIVDASADTSNSYLSYTIDPEGQYIDINGLRATRNQYPDGTFTRTGDFYFLVRIEDKGDPTDRGIWLPVAVRVNNTTPSQIRPAAIADSTSSEVDTDAKGNKVMYFSPMGIGTLTADASIRDDSKHIRGLAEDVDTFAVETTASVSGQLKTYMYNEFLVLDMDQFGGSTAEYPNGVIETEFYRIEPHKMYASSVTAAKIGKNQTIQGSVSDMSWKRYDEWGTDIKSYSDSIIEFWGIKITFLRSTHGVYIQQPIVIKDTRNADNSKTKPVGGNLDGLVNLLVKIDNNPVTINDAATLEKQEITARRDYKDKDSGIWTHRETAVEVSSANNSVVYTVPNGYTFEITPYDLARDIDMADGWQVGANTNTNRKFSMWKYPENSTDNSAEYDLDSDYQNQFDKAHDDIANLFYTSNPLELSTTPETLKLDRLAFDGSAQMISSTGGTATVTTLEDTRSSYVTVTTTTRTSAGNPLAFRVKISDGASIAEITVQVNVRDNLPEIRTDAKKVFYLSSNINGVNDTTTNSSDDYQGNNYQGATANRDLYDYGYNIREFRPTDIAEDYEPDTLYFADATFTFYSLVRIDSDKTVQFDGKTYYEFKGGSSYVTAEFAQATGGRSGQVFKVTARSSTQDIPGGLFVGINITDNYGYDASANRAEIIIQLEVRNSAPALNRDVDLGFSVVDKIVGGDNPELNDPSSDTVSYEWKISPNDEKEVTNADYYVASSRTVYDALVASGVAPKSIRILTADNDALQKLYLYAGKGNENTDNDYPNLPVYGLDTAVNRDPSTANDIAMMFTLPDGYSDMRMASLVFCDSNGNIMPAQPYKEVVGGSNTTIASRLDGYTGKQEIVDKYVDNPNWAIKITTQRSFASPMRFTVRVRDSLDNSRDEVRYDGKRVLNDDGTVAAGTAKIDGYREFTFYFHMGSMGMIAPHEVYTPDYEYEDGSGATVKPGFKYNGITLGSSGALVPLSYFAYTGSLPGLNPDNDANLVATSAVSFNGAYFNRSSQADMLSRLTLTDGTNIWSGSEINENPYIRFEIRTDTGNMGTEPSIGFDAPYFNTNLRSSQKNTVTNYIYENRQGIRLNVRGPRPSTPLKLTLDLALYENLNSTPTIAEDESDLPITANVAVDVTIANEPIKIVDTSSATGSTQIFEYDTGASIPAGNVSAYTFKLFDSDTTTSTSSSDTLYVRYTDNNKLRLVESMSPEAQTAYKNIYRDTARFLQSSLGTSGAPLSASQLRHMVKADGLQNTADETLVQIKNLAEYLGIDVSSNDHKVISQLMLDYADTLESGGTVNKVNEGYDDYFTIDDGFDSDSFTVRPIKKTTFDYTKATGYDPNKTYAENFDAVAAYAKTEKHLETELVSNGYKFYFPLKVIIYDTYSGTSFNAATWQLLTIKLRINNSAPVANSSLYTADKYFDISVTLEDNYRLNVADAVSDRDFLMIDGRFANKWELTDRGIVDTSDYLVINNDGSEKYYYADVANATAPTSDVIGYANYRANPAGDSTGTYVRGALIPESERVIDVSADFETNSSGSKYIKSVTFKALKKVTGRIWVVLRFRDNNGAFADFNVLVQVANKAPELLHTRDNGELSGVKQTTLVYGRDGMNAAAPEIVMKTGDYFDITVTPYDMYMNALSAEDKNKFNPSSQNIDAFGPKVNFNKLETADNKFIRDSTALEGQKTYLGAYVIAEDDSPETLRLNSISTSGLNNKLSVMAQNVYTSAGVAHTLSYRIEARGVANRLPLTVTVSDGSYTVSVIFTITVKSTPPKVSTDPADDAALADKGIEHVRPGSDPAGEAVENGVSEDDLNKNVLFNVRLKMSDKPFTVNLKDLCKDPDAGDADRMYLYEAFSGSCFSVGGNTSGVTESAYVSLQPILGSDSRAHSFTITPVNFMSGGEDGSDKRFEQIVFYVMDANGQSLENAQKIIMNVYVEPNELTGTSENTENPNTKNFYDFTVKSKTAYNAADITDKPSRLTVVTPSANTEKAGAAGLIIDPDYGASKTAYTMSVYAMLRKKTDEAGNVTWESMANSVREFTALNVTAEGAQYTPFELKRYVYDSASGSMITESAYDANVNIELYRYVAQYFEFDISADGATINFTPVDTTKRSPVPLYVKVQKRDVPDDAKYRSDAYLAVSVDNSAPTATVEGLTNADFYDGMNDDGFLTFSGYIGDSRTYTLHDKSEQTHGLFADLDTNDNVVLNEARGGENRGWEILPSYDYGDGVVNTSTGYLRDNTKGLGPALEVTTTAGSITVKFMRKIDAGDTESAEFVRLPMRVYGIDSMGATVQNDIILKVYNSAPHVRDWEEEGANPPTAVGYTLKKSTGDTFLLEATVERGAPISINISDIYRDVDTYGFGSDNPTNASSACDTVNFVGDASRGYLSDISGKPTALHSVTALGGTDELFRISSPNANNSVLRILCTSYSRGSVGEATLRIADGSGAATKDIVIRLTVANSAPTIREGVLKEIDMFGSEGETDEFGVTVVEASYFNILSYITDNNVKDLTKYYEGLELTENPTFLRISSVTLGDTTIGGGEILIEPPLSEGATVGNINVLNAGVSETNPQEFYIRPLPGVYGWQNVTLRVQDDGNDIFCEDALSCEITLRIRIAYGSDSMITNVIDIDRGRSKLVTIGDILDRYETDSLTGTMEFKEYSNGYKLMGIDLGSEAHRVELITQPMDNGTISYSLKVKPVAAEGTEIGVTAKCRVGSIEKDVPFKVKVGVNANPVLKAEFGPDKSYKFESSQESRDDGYIHLPASFFFTDDSEVDVMKFQSVKSDIESILLAQVKDQDGVNEIMMKFKANRPVLLTMSVVDETMETVTVQILVECPDKPDLSFFASAIIYIKSNPLLFAIILGALLLLIIILLIIILTVRKKRKMRKEIEALLVSEMEMEEQMFKLSAGQQTTAYNNSFGYLPPVQPPMTNAPLLGQGGPTQGAVPPSNAIGLNPGGSDSGNPPKNNDGFDGDGF